MVTRAKDGFTGTANKTIQLSGTAEELLLVNDGTSPLTFTTGVFTFTLGPGEVFDEGLDPFRELKITATGAYRGYVRDVN